MSGRRSVLVTGASGFLGGHVARRLAADGHQVTVMQRSSHHPPCVHEVLYATELTPACVTDLLHGRRFDWLVHMASAGTHPADRDIETLFRINVDVTRTLTKIAACWPARAAFIAGTGSEYAPATDHVPLIEQSPLEAHRLYPASKAAGTLSALAIATAMGLPLVAGRLFGIYGAGEASHRLLPTLFSRLRAEQRVPLSGGQQLRDFLYVDDAVDAVICILHALELRPGALVMNVATGKAVSVRLFAETVADVIGADRALLGFGDLPQRPDDVLFFSGDPSLISAFAGWKPQYDLKAGVVRGVETLERGLRV
jgi:UDP-glucose 4-epimerase